MLWRMSLRMIAFCYIYTLFQQPVESSCNEITYILKPSLVIFNLCIHHKAISGLNPYINLVTFVENCITCTLLLFHVQRTVVWVNTFPGVVASNVLMVSIRMRFGKRNVRNVPVMMEMPWHQEVLEPHQSQTAHVSTVVLYNHYQYNRAALEDHHHCLAY